MRKRSARGRSAERTRQDARWSRGDRPSHLPGFLIIRFKEGAVRGLPPATPGMAARSVKRLAAAVPEGVTGPLDYLTTRMGMRSMQPLFIRGGTARAAVGPKALSGIPRYRALAASAHASRRETLRGFHLVRVDEKAITGTAVRTLRGSPAVELVERAPNRWLCASAPDPSLNLQWGLRAIRWFHARRPDASAVKVTVLDSGIDMRHPDLRRVVTAYRHDGSSAKDRAGHGTHVAGIIAAVANNGVGIAGVANCRIAMWKVFSDDDEFKFDLYLEGLGSALDDGTRVVNLSLGGVDASETERRAFQELVASRVVVVAAMGNEFEEGNPVEYPAAFDGVLGVGAVDETRRRASFSNTGAHVDVVAPGVNILSTTPLDLPPAEGSPEYDSWPGTSMATPHVTGLAALVFARRPQATAADVIRRITKRAQKVAGMKGKSFTREYGYGLIDVRRALA